MGLIDWNIVFGRRLARKVGHVHFVDCVSIDFSRDGEHGKTVKYSFHRDEKPWPLNMVSVWTTDIHVMGVNFADNTLPWQEKGDLNRGTEAQSVCGTHCSAFFRF